MYRLCSPELARSVAVNALNVNVYGRVGDTSADGFAIVYDGAFWVPKESLAAMSD